MNNNTKGVTIKSFLHNIALNCFLVHTPFRVSNPIRGKLLKCLPVFTLLSFSPSR